MNKIKIISLIMCLIIVCNVLCGCSKDSNSENTNENISKDDLYLSAEKRIAKGSYTSTTEYDKYGRVIKKSVYNSYYEETTDVTTYEYDDNGRLISETYENSLYDNYSYSYTMEYSDKDDGSIGVSSLYNDMIFKDLGYKELYYDLDNNLIKEVYYDDDRIKRMYEFEYYDNGQVKNESQIYDYDFTYTASGETYEASQLIKVYDENGNHIETISNIVYSDGTVELKYKQLHTPSEEIPSVVANYVSTVFPNFQATVEERGNGESTVEIAWTDVGDNKYKLCVYDSNLYDEDEYILIELDENGRISGTTEFVGDRELTSTFEYDDYGNLTKISWMEDNSTTIDIEYIWTAK